ncbi:hypothetical protein DL89DRAFT_56896 [Linderina pennispora]|uniref:Uncharacterized protein n=1 Tax=Linderina pennispora TaxID=61395 RepID=A0A1Y1W264_9FUNG|nr:uncharacterized protein DL89DRAFT_56896 [Linderina pennispora]ORX67336.1 hypothetical protein DL89DRAFT_56896 [Linderina pennispora]
MERSQADPASLIPAEPPRLPWLPASAELPAAAIAAATLGGMRPGPMALSGIGPTMFPCSSVAAPLAMAAARSSSSQPPHDPAGVDAQRPRRVRQVLLVVGRAAITRRPSALPVAGTVARTGSLVVRVAAVATAARMRGRRRIIGLRQGCGGCGLGLALGALQRRWAHLAIRFQIQPAGIADGLATRIASPQRGLGCAAVDTRHRANRRGNRCLRCLTSRLCVCGAALLATGARWAALSFARMFAALRLRTQIACRGHQLPAYWSCRRAWQ